MKRNNNKIIFFLEVVLLTVIIITTGVNMFVNNDFYNITISQSLTLIIAITIAFWATQQKNEQRKAKEHAEQLIIKLQTIVVNNDFIHFVVPKDDKEYEEKRQQILIRNRKIKNYISILKEYSKTLGFEKEINYVEQEYNNYYEFVSDKLSDMDYLSKSTSQLNKHAENIDSKCESIIMGLYI